MTDYHEFRRRAMYCATLAQTIGNPADRMALLEMAQRWEQLAEAEKALEPRRYSR